VTTTDTENALSRDARTENQWVADNARDSVIAAPERYGVSPNLFAFGYLIGAVDRETLDEVRAVRDGLQQGLAQIEAERKSS
jgi:hypothetical protein